MRIGIMQGRLVPPEGGRFQSFPQAWREEFVLAPHAGIDYIEWIVDSQPNPIFQKEGRDEINALKVDSNIATPAICADWFMEHPLREDFYQWKQRLQKLMDIAPEIGSYRIILPFVDNSSMKNAADMYQVVKALENTYDDDVEIHLETDLAPTLMAELLARLPPHCKANWDSGNSSGLGYVASKEFAAYGDRIGSIHIKDRYRKPEGGVETRPLGEGSADFADVFRSIRSVGYDGDFTLQVARGADGDEVNWIRRQANFVRERACTSR